MLTKVLGDMYVHNRYHEILVIVDTCQAGSLIPSVLQHRMFPFLCRSYRLDLPFWQVVQWEKRVIRMALTSK